LSKLTQADIAASNNLTGKSQSGGDWDLEVTTGQIESQVSFASMANYDSVLATYNGNEYQLTSTALTWQQAEAEAVALGGHLVTINDLAEQRWLASIYNNGQKLWIGLNDRTTEGQFHWTTDDGVRLWVNNNLIIDKFVNQSATNHEGTISLVAGQKYDIRLEYYENAGAAVAQLSWSSNSQALEIVPQSQLYSPITSDRTFTQETVISQLTQPTAIDWSPNGNLLYIAEKRGVIKVLSSGSTTPTTFTDLSAQVNGTRDRGLLDIAIHPDFFNGSPYVYALYTYDPPQVNQNTGLAGADGIGNRAARLTRLTG
jgi:hypothetical protein